MNRGVARRSLKIAGVAIGSIGLVAVVLPFDAAVRTVLSVALLGLGWAALVVLLVPGDKSERSTVNHVRSELRAHDARELDRTNRILESIEAERAKESRHEYSMEQSLARIEERVGLLTAKAAVDSDAASEVGIDVLFVTSNGAGLGHLTRLRAIAKHLHSSFKVEFLTLSRAYRLLAGTGDVVHYFPSADAAGVSTSRWNRSFTKYLAHLIHERRPRVLVFDGTWVYQGLTYVSRAQDVPLVWVQRGNWRNEVDAASIQRHNAAAFVDEVILPADYAVEEDVDVGPGVTAVRTPPITLTKPSDLFNRHDSIDALGLDTSYRYVLVNLGGGSQSVQGDLGRAACNAIATLGQQWKAVLVASPLSDDESDLPRNTVKISAYPIAQYFKAFEFSVSAAGYNSVQESISLRMPSVLVPNPNSVTDDQGARARGAEAKGWAIVATNPLEISDAVQELAGEARRAAMKEALSSVDESGGAMRAAQALSEVVARAKWKDQAERIGPGRE